MQLAASRGPIPLQAHDIVGHRIENAAIALDPREAFSRVRRSVVPEQPLEDGRRVVLHRQRRGRAPPAKRVDVRAAVSGVAGAQSSDGSTASSSEASCVSFPNRALRFGPSRRRREYPAFRLLGALRQNAPPARALVALPSPAAVIAAPRSRPDRREAFRGNAAKSVPGWGSSQPRASIRGVHCGIIMPFGT